MRSYCGWDIGGVHLKLSRLAVTAGAASITTRVRRFEIWKAPGRLADEVRALLAESDATDGPAGDSMPHGLTMTAELSDIFASRAEGVRHILQGCAPVFAGMTLRIVDGERGFVDLQEAMERPLAIAAANWTATARLVGRIAPRALLIDTGSTTTDIIPILRGRPATQGFSDTERLISGELVYTGLLRTPPSSFADSVPIGGAACQLAAEQFATTADVYRVLQWIDLADDTTPTADGRGRSRHESAARLARLVCSDLDTLGLDAVVGMARSLADRQIDQIASGIRSVLARHSDLAGAPAIVAGVGALLAGKAAARAGLGAQQLCRLLPSVAGEGWDRSAASAAVALLLAAETGGCPGLPT